MTDLGHKVAEWLARVIGAGMLTAIALSACGGGDEQPTERPVLLPGGGQVKK